MEEKVVEKPKLAVEGSTLQQVSSLCCRVIECSVKVRCSKNVNNTTAAANTTPRELSLEQHIGALQLPGVKTRETFGEGALGILP